MLVWLQIGLLLSARLRGVDRQLGGESPLVRGPRFAARDVGGQCRELVQEARRSQPEQHRHHHQVARAERPIEPVGIAQAGRELGQPIANAVLDQRQARFGPGLVALRESWRSRVRGSAAPRC